MDIQFANPRMLLLIWLVPAVAAWWYVTEARRERLLAQFMSPDLQRKLRPPSSRRRFLAQLVLLTTGMALGVVAAARPQWGEQEERVFQRGRDLLVVLDVSRSMLATDVRPNRLERAKADILDLVKELRGDRAGLLVFRRRATLLCPLTTDYAFFTQALEGATPEAAPAGETDIGAAITAAMDAFESDGGAHRAVVLISDGEDLVGGARAAAEAAAKKGLTIFTVGLGSRDGASIPDANQASGVASHQGASVRTRLNNDTLNEIAMLTKGAYIPVETAGMTKHTLGELYRDHLRAIDDQDIEESLQRRYVERFQWFLGPAFLCMLAAAFCSRGRLATRRSSPSPAPAASAGSTRELTPAARPLNAIGLALLLGASGVGMVRAQTNGPAPAMTATDTNVPALPEIPPGRTGARMAQVYFVDGDYARAAAAYLEAAKGATDDSRRDFRYNAAIAHYRAGRFREAAELLRTLEDERDTNEAHAARVSAALGDTLFQEAAAIPGDDAKALQERARLTRQAAEAFRHAVRTRPADPDARHNVTLATEALKERDEAARIAGLLAKHQGTEAGKLAAEMLTAQRKINAGMALNATNASPSRIQEYERLAKQQRANAELWVPLKGRLMEAGVAAGTNGPANMAELGQMIELTRDGMLEAAHKLRDLDSSAAQHTALAEATVYQFWRAAAQYDDILREDLWRQTNAIQASVANASPRARARSQAEQREARALTELFVERFTQQVPEPGAQGLAIDPSAGASTPGAQVHTPVDGVSTNIDRAKILDLSRQATLAQNAALNFLGTDDPESARAQQELSHRILKEIETLLPKSTPQQQQQDQQQESQQNQDQEQQDSAQKDEQQPSEQPQDQPQGEDEQQEPEPQAPEPEEAEQQQAAASETNALPEDVERMLERALQREREHEASKRRATQVPLSPIDRDW